MAQATVTVLASKSKPEQQPSACKGTAPLQRSHQWLHYTKRRSSKVARSLYSSGDHCCCWLGHDNGVDILAMKAAASLRRAIKLRVSSPGHDAASPT